MTGKILICAATKGESECLKMLEGVSVNGGRLSFRGLQAEVLVTGIGSVSTLWTLSEYLNNKPLPALVINIGIAGSFTGSFPVGSLMFPVTDTFADLGLEDDEKFVPLWQWSNREGETVFPGELVCDRSLALIAEQLFTSGKAITVNTVSGSVNTIQKLRSVFDPDIETMEGAAVYYACNMKGIPCIALRAISNMVEIRDTDAWNIPLALESLSEGINRLIEKIIKEWN